MSPVKVELETAHATEPNSPRKYNSSKLPKCNNII